MRSTDLPCLLLVALTACSSAGPDPLGPQGTAGGSTSSGGGSGGQAGATGSGGASGGSEICGPGAPTGLQVGDCAPDFTLPDADGVPFSLWAQRGKVALVDISAVW